MTGRSKSLCFCGRPGRGFAFHRFDRQTEPVHCCSMQHLDIIMKRKGERMSAAELDALEREAVDAASEAAGSYLELIGKTDLAAMTADEWTGFLAHVFKAVSGEAGRLAAERATPF